ncbi:MAG: carbon-nitrogen hydrolase family protein [Robiginitomaculum sp.]|nr:carbon-nitrogen hydrolase family protein [Robiginitomaculum sp.]MDQ7076728.1 carbon-nitrogen hydrolase family protein [Robiginitomaculum sp.]
MSNPIIKGAVVQAGTCLYDTPRTVQKFEDLLADAARAGAELVVFPEAFIGGYPKGADFGARVGSRTPAGRADYQRYYDSALALDGPELTRMSKAVAKAKTNVVVGVMEKGGATLYCTALYFAKDGTLVGKHRKLMPTAMERLIWGFGDGSTLAVQNMDVGKVGALICWENYMPLARTHMYSQGVEFYCSPTVDDRPVWTPSMQHIAIEGRCFVLSAVQHMRRFDAPDDYICADGDAPDTVLINGGSCIVSPFGELLAGPVFGEDVILTADLDKSLITRGKYDLDTVGHYARPDVFSLRVNTAPQNAVVEED